MDRKLARRLVTRPDASTDINPDGLSVDQIKALEISESDWRLLLEIEHQGKRRLEVIEYAISKIYDTEPVKPVKETAAKPPAKKGRSR